MIQFLPTSGTAHTQIWNLWILNRTRNSRGTNCETMTVFPGRHKCCKHCIQVGFVNDPFSTKILGMCWYESWVAFGAVFMGKSLHEDCSVTAF